MSITFEQVNFRITRYDAGLMKNGWDMGQVTEGQRAVINGKKTPNIFFKSRDQKRSCEAAIGTNCEVLSLN